MEFNGPIDFKEPILKILRDRGGHAKTKDIYADFEERYGKYLSPRYLTNIVDGDVRWRDEINRCRYQFLRPSLIPPSHPDYKKGTWELL